MMSQSVGRARSRGGRRRTWSRFCFLFRVLFAFLWPLCNSWYPFGSLCTPIINSSFVGFSPEWISKKKRETKRSYVYVLLSIVISDRTSWGARGLALLELKGLEETWASLWTKRTFEPFGPNTGAERRADAVNRCFVPHHYIRELSEISYTDEPTFFLHGFSFSGPTELLL
jgi:hypothetical protein